MLDIAALSIYTKEELLEKFKHLFAEYNIYGDEIMRLLELDHGEKSDDEGL